ncbi:hypothetical protein MTR64_02495 [Novosphingobium sp. 2580]|uniref:Uncharacterized protein n=1 Tax=Novosphingobium album (ex Hu et al. 2023) TaxID=2930093 RepID=A0ABT0AXQ1_9SPHN|nr:hypothetical protein [Novosphingobium album (ex Hu et al. 2023)]
MTEVAAATLSTGIFSDSRRHTRYQGSLLGSIEGGCEIERGMNNLQCPNPIKIYNLFIPNIPQTPHLNRFILADSIIATITNIFLVKWINLHKKHDPSW